MQLAHLVGQGGLVAHGGGHTAQQGGHLAARLDEAEDVVDEQQHVFVLHVPEVLGHGQPRQGHPQTHAGGLVHLAEDQGGLAGHAALPHLPPKVVALPGALAHAGENGVAAVLHGHVVNQLLNEHGFAHAGPAEQADFAATGIGLQQVDHLDARLQNLHRGALLLEGGGLAVDGAHRGALGHRAAAVNGLAQHVEHTP